MVSVKVKPGMEDSFIRATIRNHEASVKEPGNMRFDVLRDDGDPAAFVLYEAYATKEAAAAHKDTPHYRVWKEEVADMMAVPRVGKPFTAIRPS